MDPFNVTGLIMNSLTIPAQLFSSGVVAYTTVSDVKTMGSSFGKQYWLFKVQESRYLIWGMCHNGCNPGGLDLDDMPAPIREAVVNALVQISDILRDKDAMCTRYGLQRVADIQPRELSIIRRESQRQQNMVSSLHKSSSLLRKLQWVIRDQGRFGELNQQLTCLVDTLYEMLPMPRGAWIDDTITAQTLADTLISGGGSKAVEDIQQQNDPQLIALRQLNRANIAASNREQVENSTHTLQVSATPHLYFDVRHLEFLGPNLLRNASSHIRSWARLRQINPIPGEDLLLVEWREYDLRREEESKASLQARIEALVKMLKEKPRSDSFRIFDCIGYFLDNSEPRFGLTFRLPSNYSLQRDPAPMSLFDLMTDYPKDIPYLGDRFRLAYLLAESVHALHASGWLHKSLCSRNILLLRKNMRPALPGISQRPLSLESPYFTGFALSRPDGPAADSSLTAPLLEVAIYRHIDVQGLGGRAVSRYRAIYDIYSLGMVLLEIGTWKTVQSFYPQDAAPGFEFGNYILRKIVPRLGVSMGENYMDVVRKCLEGTFERLAAFGQDEYDTLSYRENVRQGLLWEVVDVLRKCRA